MVETIKVLLIEDEEVDQMAFNRFVLRENLPYETVTAGSLAQARDSLKNHTFDIILADYSLDGETAFELLEEIAQRKETAAIPCIVITGLGDEEIAVKAMKLGAVDYLTKDPAGNYLKTLHPVVLNAIKLKKAEAELEQYRRNLERMVVERTEELVKTNTRLQLEIIERTQAEEQILLQSNAKIQAQEKLVYLATHDMLTGLPNRVLFGDRLAHALAIANRTAEQGAVLLIDLDNFKSINDAFSHDVGDEFLKIIAGRFQGCLRESDTVARIGGDEFAILLENIDQNGASCVAQKVNRVLAEPTSIQENVLISTASIGISMFPHDGNASQQLMKNADLAMYHAKEIKNTFQFYDHDMTVTIEKEMELNTYMRYALQNDIFQLHYQPQVDSKSGRVIGMEALLRLPHPRQQWIPPSEFIPLAERTGLILAIDEWVLRSATRKMKEITQAGFQNIRMSVNLSNRLLHQANLIDILQDVLKQNTLAPALMELEISEGSVFNNSDRMIQTMSWLKELGLRLAIDDFGTGYAALSYLARFPLDTLKIDRTFTRRIVASRKDMAIVSGVIAIANNLKLSVVVEGVESREQLELFSGLGCHQIQGFFYSPAVEEGKVEDFLKNGFQPFRR